MHRFVMGFCALALVIGAAAAPALADGSARDVQAALDSYLAHDTADVALVGGPGSAGYDNGFWIRGGDFLLRADITLQRFREPPDWKQSHAARGSVEAAGSCAKQAHSLSDTTDFGERDIRLLSPRATLKLSGERPAAMRWYMELGSAFGH
ncbi:MAG: hypothetical protein H6805_09880 [Planctomycetes bacterium]|nr:hypothetical protein [Planctomycetota bacterium]